MTRLVLACGADSHQTRLLISERLVLHDLIIDSGLRSSTVLVKHHLLIKKILNKRAMCVASLAMVVPGG